MRAIITCGGTGGHITPALAIADIIKENDPGADILFVGGNRGMEGEMVTRAGYPIRLLRVRGFSRSLSFSNITALKEMHRARICAMGVIEEFSPDIVVGTGGYACYPTLRAAIAKGIPCAVHESNAVPGLAVRALAKKLGRVWLNFESARASLPKGVKTLSVGNPLPRDYVQPKPICLPDGTEKMLLSFGGSLGAGEINRAVLELMKKEKSNSGIYHLHASGKREYERMSADFRAAGLDRFPHLEIVAFLTPMSRYMAAASLVISRAGAMTISELCALGCPAILVPSPNVTGNHQYKNACALAQAGAAIVLEERELSERLCREVDALMADGERREAMQRAMKRFYVEDANAVIWYDIQRLLRGL